MSVDDYYRGRRVLVTGGLGFIGSNLARRLVGAGAEVVIFDSLVPEHGGKLDNVADIRDRLRLNLADMRDRAVLRLLVRDTDDVFHLAGQVSHGDSMRDPHTDLGVNCVSTMNLVEACRQDNPRARLVFTSTRQVYGRARSLPVTEDHPTVPVDVNGINKLAAEYYHLLYDEVYGVRSTVLRLTNTYGPHHQIRNDRQGFIGIMMRQALHGETLKVFGSGAQVRDFNYVVDVVDALMRAGANDACFGRVFNLGADQRYSVLQFVAELHGVVPLRYEVVPFPDSKKIIDIGDYYGDDTAFRAVTGWRPAVDLPEGLTKTVDWMRRHEEFWA